MWTRTVRIDACGQVVDLLFASMAHGGRSHRYRKSHATGFSRMDTLTPEERSERMSRVRGKDTKPEMILRRLIHGIGYRYRLHDRRLPGCPDLVFKSRHKVIFVHGCFWHRHEGCRLCRMPKSRQEFWIQKLNANKKRDVANQEKLAAIGWNYLIVWECEIPNTVELVLRIRSFLGSAGHEGH
jgi:DNA mismatch endonuclease (patch repair protein)